VRLGDSTEDAEVQPVSFSPDGESTLPPGVSVMVTEPR